MSGASSARTNACPKCQNQNPTDAVFCGFCGANLRERKAAAPERATLFGYVADGVLHTGTAAPPAAAPGRAEELPRPAADRRPSQQPGVAPQVAPAAAPAAAAPVPPLVGGRYRRGAPLGRLAIGELCATSDAAGDQPLTLLLVDAAALPSTMEVERARRELRQLQKAESPHLLRVLDHGRGADDQFFIVIEGLHGVTLADRVAKGPLSLAAAAHIANGVAEALAAVQKVGVVHRDVSPENVWLQPDGSARLLCCSVAPPIKVDVHGTAAFISPEQASGRPVDQRSNIYSLGALVYFMLAGEAPFAGDPAALVRQHQEVDPPRLAQRRPELELPPRIDELIGKAMAKAPSQRHLTLRQLLRELDAIVTPAVAAAPLPSARAPQSMITPVHGVTALSGGDRPPASDWSPDRASGLRPATAAPLHAPLAEHSSAAASAGPPSRMTSAGSLLGMASGAVSVVAADAPGGGRARPPSEAVAPQAAAAPEKSELERTRAVHREPPTQAEAEVRSDLPVVATPTPARASAAPVAAAVAPTLAPTTVPAVAPTVTPKTAPKTAPTVAPSSAPTAAKDAPAGGAPAKEGAFRETMWFFRGEVESAMAEQGTGPEATLPDAKELAEKYTNDADLSSEAAQRLSLRTGKTQMMQAPAVPPTGALPGARMEVEELVEEFNQGRKIGIALGVVLAVALLGAIVWFVLR